MDDHKLLEFSAKSVGIKLRFNPNDPCESYGSNSDYLCEWNVLKDDGDALRTAVLLGLTIKSIRSEYTCHTIVDSGNFCAYAMHDGDAFEATRRAIAIVAAKIGEAA